MILMLFLLVIVIGTVAFAVDAGLVVLLRAEIQNAVDSGALAAALQLQDDQKDMQAARAEAQKFIQLNSVGMTQLVASNAIEVQVGYFDKETDTFTTPSLSPNAVRVVGRQEEQPFFFARIFGQTTFGAPAEAIAGIDPRPLDIMMVLDLTASMKEAARIKALHKAAPTFVDVIEEMDSDDQIGMMGITANPDTYDPVAAGHSGGPYASGLHPSSDCSVAVLEAVLDVDFSYLKNTALSSKSLEAGKYMGGTGIGAGIADATHYLIYGPEAREKTKKVIVLMTDGEANKPTGAGADYARAAAEYAASLNVTVYTISLGNEADVGLNQDIADITGGLHFNATGAGKIPLTVQLTEAFEQAANALKRVKLVK